MLTLRLFVPVQNLNSQLIDGHQTMHREEDSGMSHKRQRTNSEGDAASLRLVHLRRRYYHINTLILGRINSNHF